VVESAHSVRTPLPRLCLRCHTCICTTATRILLDDVQGIGEVCAGSSLVDCTRGPVCLDHLHRKAPGAHPEAVTPVKYVDGIDVLWFVERDSPPWTILTESVYSRERRDPLWRQAARRPVGALLECVISCAQRQWAAISNREDATEVQKLFPRRIYSQRKPVDHSLYGQLKKIRPGSAEKSQR